jgi:small subunit ribosomal protein S3
MIAATTPGLFRNNSTSSVWFTDNKRNYSRFLFEDFKLREMINTKLKSSMLGNISISRTNNATILTVESAKPGSIIGQKGKGIEALILQINSTIRKHLMKNFSSSQSTPININIIEIRKPDSHCVCIANKIADKLVARMPARRVMKSAVNAAMRSNDLRGISIRCAGRLSIIARAEKAGQGSVSKGTIRDKIQLAQSVAFTRSGTIGVTVAVSKKQKSPEGRYKS